MKLIVLNRDGVINQASDQYIKSPEEWRPIPGSLEAIARLGQAGYKVVVVSDEAGIGRGLYDMAILNAIHNKMHKAVAQAGGRLEAVFFCPLPESADSDCRAPKPGLLKEIVRRYHQELKGVPVVGDELRDLLAAKAMGARPILVLSGKGGKMAAADLPDDIPTYPDLATAVNALLVA